MHKISFGLRINIGKANYLKISCFLLILGSSGCSDECRLDRIEPHEIPKNHPHAHIDGALLGTRFESVEDLEQFVEVEYCNSDEDLKGWGWSKPSVVLRYKSAESEVESILTGGVDQDDFKDARDGNILDKVRLVLCAPYSLFVKDDLIRIFYLSRRRHHQFGASDVAFFDLAERMACNIHEYQYNDLATRDTTEKGFINTFNHITAQAFITTLFSERLADFIADVHERLRPELITGKFTEEQYNDLNEGPVDNYVDMINNEWGQMLGKRLQHKYDIDSGTQWTPELMADYLNDIQDYYRNAFKLEFIPFRPTDYLVIRFTGKLNKVMGDLPKFVPKSHVH